MKKSDFLTELRIKLRDIPDADAMASIAYYGEMIDDRMEDGLSEEEAVAAIGNVDDIARTILTEAPATPAPVKQHKGLRWWEITLLVLGSPVWVSLLIAAAAVVFSVWISLWSVVISLYATAIALGAAALGCILGSFFMIARSIGEFMVAWGAAFVCAGLAILIFMLANLASKGIIALTKLTWKGIRRIFTGKEQTA